MVEEDVTNQVSHTIMIEFCKYLYEDISLNIVEWVHFVDYGEGYTALGGSYSIDYMIGEPDSLRKGYGREIVIGGTDWGTSGCQTRCGSAGAGKPVVMRSFAGL